MTRQPMSRDPEPKLTSPRPRYEAPKAIQLSELAGGQGLGECGCKAGSGNLCCNTGTAATSPTGCVNGNSATQTCAAGSSGSH